MKSRVIGLLVALVIGIGTTGAHFYEASELRDKFLYNTYINDIEVSRLSYKDADKLIYDSMFPEEIELTFEDKSYTITKEDIDKIKSQSTKTFIDKINYNKWEKSLVIKTRFGFDEESIIDEIASFIMNDWDIFKENTWRYPENARLEFDETAYKVYYKPNGTALNTDAARNILKEILRDTSKSRNLSSYKEIYLLPEITDKNESLLDLLDRVNDFVNMDAVYNHENKEYRFRSSNMSNFIEFNYEDFTYSFDYEGCTTSYMDNLAKAVNSVGQAVNFTTHDGQEISITGGDWGWKLDNYASAINLATAINEKNNNPELVWERTCNSFGPDGTYVEVDLSNQKIYLFKNGEQILSSNVVSGMPKNHNTPGGVYVLKCKARNQTLKGNNDDGSKYASFVNYWMPFNGGIGLHDATWRGRFGGTIYKYNGSHGCVNLPYNTAKTIYENISSGCAIVCYWR